MPDAVMVIDAQKYWAEKNPETIKRLKESIDALRAKHGTVIWVFANDEAGPYTAAAPQRVGARQLKDLAATINKAEYSPVIQPAPGDWFVGKNATDAFTNPHLKPFLQEQGIDNLKVCGFMKGYCVYDTGSSAVREGYQTTLFEDLSADGKDLSEFGDGTFHKAGIKIENATGARLPPQPAPAVPANAAPAAPVTPPSPPAGGAATAIEGEAVAEGASRLTKGLQVGGAVAPTVLGAVIEGGTAAWQGKGAGEVLGATGHGALNGAVGLADAKVAFNGHQRPVDRILGGMKSATASATTGLGIAAPFTEGATLPFAAIAGLGNVGLGVLQDVAHWTGAADNKGILQQTFEMVTGFFKSSPAEVADSALYRALLPLNSVARNLFGDPDIRGKMSPEMGQAINRFRNMNAQSSLQRVEEGSQFAKELAKGLRDKGPEGDALRKAMAPALQKAGSTPESYAAALDNYARELDKADARMKAMKPDEYAKVVQQSADDLQNSMKPAVSTGQPPQQQVASALRP